MDWKTTGKKLLFVPLWLLVLLTVTSAVLLVMAFVKGRQETVVAYMVYVLAFYTLSVDTVFCVSVLPKQYRALGSPIMSTAKIVSLSAALVSMLNLETAMFAQFGQQMAQKDQRLMIIFTGAGVSLTVVTLSAVLIVKATKEIRRDKYGK